MDKTRQAEATPDDLKRKDLIGFLTRMAIMIAIDSFVIWFSYEQAKLGNYVTVTVLSMVALMLSFILLYKKGYPLRWMAPGLALLLLFNIYPNILTIYIAFTNYGTGHLLSEVQTIELFENRKFLPEGGDVYDWTAFKSDDGEYALWLLDDNGDGYLAYIDEPLQQVEAGEAGVGEFDSNGIPVSIDGYSRLNAIVAATDTELPELLFGDPNQPFLVLSSQEAAQLQQLYVYDLLNAVMVNQETGVVYTPIDGTFTAPNGDSLSPGYQANIGTDNFVEFFTSAALRGPLLIIAAWNFVFPILAVVTQFGLGLFIAMLFNDPKFPGRKLIRSVLILPFTIPSLITILIWRGMLNSEYGIINRILFQLFEISPDWFQDKWLAKAVIVLVTLWLGFPYFMLISMGALQSIPEDIYNAAEVDGANAWQRFRRITLPLVLVALGPLLLASYVNNFNNFLPMFLLGGPPIVGTPTPANHVDILISYVYRLAFEGGRGQAYGLASAISIIIFAIVFVLTLVQFRYTNMLEEVSENV